MKNKWFSYIYINTEKSFVQTSGITWNEFYHGIGTKPQNLLLLSGYSSEMSVCKLNMDCILSKEMEKFTDSDVYDFGDFCWVDFPDSASLDNVTDNELAELLFFRHMCRPLTSYTIPSLQNRYAYWGHDDGWFTRVYMERPEEYKQVIEYKILKELKGRKRSIEPIPTEIMNVLFVMFQGGAVLDFEGSTASGVRVYAMGNVSDMDSIHCLLDRHRSRLSGTLLWYDTRTKKWSISD